MARFPNCPSMRRSVWPGLLLVAALSSSVFSDSPADRRVRQDEQLLDRYGFKAEAASIEALLKSFDPDALDTGEIERLLKQLNAPEFAVREAASKALINLPRLPSALLDKALKSDDAELRFRARLILKSRSTQNQRQLELKTRVAPAALRVVAAKRLRVSMQVLLDSVARLPGEEEQQACVNAILATAQRVDLKLLQTALKSDQSAVQVAAIRALPRVSPVTATESILLYARSTPGRVALSALHSLAELGDRRCLKQLVANLDAEESFIRIRSLQLLRAISDKNFGLNVYADRRGQAVARAAWNQWLRKKGEAVVPTSPIRYTAIRLRPLRESVEFGLIAHYGMEKGDGVRLSDAGPRKLHGSIHGSHKFIKGPRRNALRLEGAGTARPQGGHANIPYIDFNKLEAFTVSLWVEHERLSYPHGEAFVCYGFDQGTTMKGSLCIGTFFERIHFRVGDGILSIPHAKADHKRWVHYAMTYSDGKLRVYKDGVLVAQGNVVVNVKGNRAAIGRHWWTNGSQSSTRFIGAIDDVRVYERALTNQQVSFLAKP